MPGISGMFPLKASLSTGSLQYLSAKTFVGLDLICSAVKTGTIRPMEAFTKPICSVKYPVSFSSSCLHISCDRYLSASIRFSQIIISNGDVIPLWYLNFIPVAMLGAIYGSMLTPIAVAIQSAEAMASATAELSLPSIP